MARVLVIDDSDVVRALLAALLRAQGHETGVAAGGDAGLASFREAGADLVLCELFLRGLDGLDVLRRLREAAPGVRFVLMAAAGAAQRADLARTAGLLGVGLLLKPFALCEVADAVRHALGAEGAEGMASPSEEVILG